MSKKYLEDQIRKKKREEEETQEEQDKPVIRKPGARQQNTNRRPATATPQTQSTTSRTTGGYPQTYAMDTYNGDLEHDKYLYLMQNQHVGYTGDPEHDMQLAQQRQQYNDQRAQISRENSRNWFVGEGAMRIGQVLRSGFGAALGQTPDRGMDLLEQQQFFRYMEQMGNEAGDAELSKRGAAGLQTNRDNIKNYLQEREDKAHANLARHAVDRLTGKEAIPDAGTYSGRLENQLMLNNPQIEDYYGMYQLAAAAGDKESADRYLGYIQNLQGSNERYAQEARDAFSTMAAPENGAWMMPRDWRSKTTQEKADYWEEQKNRGIDAFRAGVMLQDQDLMNRATGYMGWTGQRLNNATANLIGEKEGPAAEYAYRYNQQELEQKKAEAEAEVAARKNAMEDADKVYENYALGVYKPQNPAEDPEADYYQAKQSYENAQAEVEVWKKAIDLEKGDEFARLEKQIPEQAKTSAEVQQQIEKGQAAFRRHEEEAVRQTYGSENPGNQNLSFDPSSDYYKSEYEKAATGYAWDTDNAALFNFGLLKENGYSDALKQNEMGWGMTVEQKETFYYLYAEDPEKAEEFAKACKKKNEDAYYAEKSKPEKNWLKRLLKEFGAANMKLVGGLLPTTTFGQQMTKEANAMIASVGAGREEYGVLNTGFLSGKLDEDIPLIGGKSLNDWTQLKSSMIMSGETAAAAKIALATGHPEAAAVIEVIGLYMQSGAAANDDYIRMKELGWDDDKAMTHALFAGLAEGVFEKVSLDKLLDQNVSRGLVRNLLTQAGVEASEEVTTSIANHITDAVQAKIYGYDNDRERRAKEYMAQGLSYNEAYNKAHVDIMTDLLEDALGGFISGGLMTGGNYASMGLTTTTGKVVSGIRNTRDIYTGANLLGMGEDVNLHQRASEGAVNQTLKDTTGGTTTAMQAYAERNGIKLKDTGLSVSVETTGAEHATPAAQTGNDTQTRSDDQKISRRGTRAVRSNVEAVTNSIADKMYSKSENVEGRMAGAVEVYEQTVSEYGEGIKPVAKAALQNTVNKIATEASNRGNVSATTAFQAKVDEIQNPETRDVVQDALDFAVYQKTTNATQRSEVMEGFRHQAESRAMSEMRAQRNKARGDMTMQATVTDENGQSKAVDIVGITEDGKAVELSDGVKIDVKALQADADTKDAIQMIASMELGTNAGKVLQAYRDSGLSGTEGYRFIADYTQAIEQGRTNRVSLERATKASSLDAKTVMEAYTIGQQIAHAETQKALDRLKNAPKKKGATGRTATIDTSAIEGVTMSQSEREQFELANRIFTALGVDLRWVASSEKNGQYVGANGSYLNGAVTLDIHAGRNFLNDIRSGILATTGHELTHFLEQYAPEQYKALKEFVLQQIVQNGKYGEETLERLIQEKKKRARNKISQREAENEVVADACQNMLLDSKAVSRFAQEHEDAAKGIVRWLDKWFGKLRSAFTGSRLSEEARMMANLEKDVKQAFGDLWDKALEEAVRMHDEVGDMENPATEGGERNSDRDTEYLELAKDPEKNRERLQEMVDEAAKRAGYDMHLYHGSKTGGGFTVFKGWQYFTENKAYAERYTQRGNPNSLYDVYVKSERMFDTRRPECREIFERMRMEYGLSDLQENGLPDWTDGYDISDFIDENDLEYDGVVLDEGGDLTENGPVSRGLSYIIRNSEQVKSADPVTYDDAGNVIPLSERFNTENQDIRFSERDSDVDVDEKRNEPLTGQIGMFGQDGQNAAWTQPSLFDQSEQKKAKTGEELFLEEMDKFKKKLKKDGGWYGKEFDKFYAENPQMNFVERFYQNDPKTKADMERFVAAIDDPKLLSDLSWYTTQSPMLKKGNYRGAVTKTRNVYKARINEIMTEKNGGRKIKIEHRKYTFDEVKDLFNSLNSNEAVAKLAEKVFAVAKDLGLDFYGTNKWYGESNAKAIGANFGKDVFLRINGFADTTLTDQYKASTIVHELIHACTSYAIDEYNAGGFSRTLNPRIREAVQMLEKVYGQARGEIPIKSFYGMTNIKEFVAELAQPEFREELQKHNLIERVLDAIKRFFGIENVKGKSYLDSASAALDFLLDEMDTTYAAKYYQEQENKGRQWERQRGESRYSERDYDIPSDMELLEGIDESELKGDEKAQVREAKQEQQKIRNLERQLARVRNELKGLEGDNPSRLSVKDFTRNVLDLFGIPTGAREDVGEMLQSIAQSVLSGQQLSREDAAGFFSYFLSQGKGRTVTDESLAQIRDELKGRKIYVNQETRADFGDDWNAFRRRAFGLGIQLTSNENNMGVDSVNAELAEMFPGSFDAGATDMRSMLENMVDTAESGKSSDVSILDAMEETAKQTGEPVQAQLQAMMDSFLRHLDIMQDRARIEAKARAGNAQELAKSKNRAAKAAAELSKARKERNDWKRKATGAEARQVNAVDRALRGVIQHDAKQLAEAVRQKQALAKKLEMQLQREEDILAGKLTPPAMQRMLKAAKEAQYEKDQKAKEAQFAGYKDRKNQTAIRNRIKNLADEMKRRMTNPTDRSYVPAALYGSMTQLADVLDDVLAPNPGTKAEARYRAVMDAIHGLSREYGAIKDIDDYTYSSEFDEEVQNQISELERILTKDRTWVDELTGDGKKLQDFNTDELQQIYDILKQINTTMANAGKIMSNSRYQTIADAMQAIVEQQQSMQGINSVSRHQKNKRMRILDNLSVMRAVEMMSGWDRDAALYQLMHAVENGVDESWRWMMEYNKSLQELKTGKNEKAYRNALTKQLDFGVTDEDGLPVKMTKMQAIQIWMTAQREAANSNLIHLQQGGAVIRDALAIQDGKAAKAKSQNIKVTPELLSKIEESLTDWDRAYIKAVRAYFAKEAKATNEILYKLKHRVLQTEENYVPYIVDKNYLDTNLDEKAAMSMWVKTPGSTNQLQKQSTLPVIIDGMDTVMAKHVKEIGDYIGLALPIRDFSKVYNGRLATNDTNPLPVKATIGKNFDAKGQHLLTQAIIDVQGGSSATNWSTAIAENLNKLQGAFVRAALLINPSVTIKQAASYSAAESILSHLALERGNHPIWASTDKSKAFAPGGLIAHIFAAPSGNTATRLYNEIDQHTSLHYQRRLGMSQAEVANEANRSGKLKRAVNSVGASMEQSTVGHLARKAGEALDPVTWIQRMDVATTAALWVACKEQAKLDGMTVGSAEFWQRTTELYERCVRETQPMYDGLHRSAQQKQHDGGIMQYLFPFRTVPIQNHGQMAASYEALLAARASGDKARIKEANRFFAKTMWAQFESAIVFSTMTFLAAAMKRKTKKYRDEDEELDVWSVLKGIGLDVAGTMVSNFNPLFGSAIWDTAGNIYDSVKTGKKVWSYDSFSIGPVDLLNEGMKAYGNLATDLLSLIGGKDVSWNTVKEHLNTAAVKSFKFLGIPSDTVKTYVEGTIGNLQDAFEGRIPALNDESWVRSTSTDAKRFVDALKEGNTTKAKNVLAGMKKNIRDANPGIKEDKLNSRVQNAINSYIHEQILSGGITQKNAIRYMVEYGGKDEDDAYWAIQEWRAKELHDGEDGYKWTKYDGLMEDIDAGEKWDNIKRSSMLELTDHGVKPETVYQQITEHIRDRFKAGELTEDETMEMMQAYSWKKDDKTKQYRRYSESEAYFKLEEWKDKAANPEDYEDSSWSQYDAMRDALRAGGDGAEELQDLLDHDVSEASAYEEYGKAVKAMLTDGTISADEAQQLLLDNWKVKDSETKEYRKPTENEVWKQTKKWAETAEHEGELDYSYSQYDTVDEAISAGKDISGLVKELTDHGIKQEDVNSHIKTYLVNQYVEGKTSEMGLKNQLSHYLGLTGGEDRDEIVRDANCKKLTGYDYGNLGKGYKAGKIPSQTVTKALTKYGGMSSSDAKARVRYWDFQKSYPDSNLGQTTLDKYYDTKIENVGRTLQGSGIGLDAYVRYAEAASKAKGTDKDGDGKTDSGSKKAAIMQIIDKLNLTTAQKDALYYFNGWSAKTIKEAPWH